MDRHPTPRPLQTHNIEYSNAVLVGLLSAGIVAVFPGSLIGAGIAWLVWRTTRPDIVTRWLLAGLGVATAVALHAAVAVGWPWRLLADTFLPGVSGGLQIAAVARSIPVEMLIGPFALVTFDLADVLWRRTVHGEEWARYREMERRRKALDRQWEGPSGGGPGASASGAVAIRLGMDAQKRQPFVISPNELAQHVFIPGASGSGKTTTLVCLADGALASGYGVVIVDCKGSGLGGSARSLASRHHLPFTIVDPQDPKTLGYDPCSGDPAAIANKLIGSFTFTGEAEIYKHVAMEVVPVICRALKASQTPVTLSAIYECLNRGALSRLGRKDGAEEYRSRLEDLDEPSGVGAAGYAGLQRRLGALMEGTFGGIFCKQPALDWGQLLQSPQVTYLSLSVTAASEDVELFARVITQDLKQVCDARMRAIERGEAVAPILLIYDEFAGLREATQIVDLLLQARQARAPLVVATQFVPVDPTIRRPLMAAGVLIAHRLEAEDAELMAAQFGTRPTTERTAQIDYETGTSEKGTVKWIEQFNMHPNELKELPVGMAAVYARPSSRRALVQIDRK